MGPSDVLSVVLAVQVLVLTVGALGMLGSFLVAAPHMSIKKGASTD